MNNRKVIKSGNHISDERAYDIIKAPIVTEKATLLSQYRQFVFETAKDANKVEIKEAIEKIFKVKVDAVNTLNRKGKEKRFRGRLGRRPDRKFATVTLAEGHTIDAGGWALIMALKEYKPNTPGQRGLVLVDRSELWKGGPIKSLTEGLKRSGGRNNAGRMTNRNIGGGHKKRYRFVDFKRTKDGMAATVERIEYDPNRTAFIALIRYEDDELSYIVAPQRLSVGDKVMSGPGADIKPGNTLELRQIPVGTIVHNIEMKPLKGAQIARSAGSYAQIIGRDTGFVMLRLSSGEQRRFFGECRATIGAVSNPDQKNINLGKAGRSRWLGRRPHVRGVVMNPVDHPHGGGEGKSSGGRHPVTPWGVPTKGYKTRNKKKHSSKYIVSRSSKK